MARKIGATFTDNVSVKLKRLEKEMMREHLKLLKKSASEIAYLASLNAPTRDGTVEESIVVNEPVRDGINHSFTYTVGVDKDMVAKKRAALGYRDPYFDYFSIWLHESIYNLGEDSQIKADIVKMLHPKARVGNKYLERAYRSLKTDIEKEAQRITDRTIKRRNSK